MRTGNPQIFAILVLFVATVAFTKRSTSQVQVPQVIRAKEFTAVDENGRQRIQIGVGKDGQPSIALRGPDGKVRALLMMTDKGDPMFMLMDKNGNPNLVLAMNARGGQMLVTDGNKARANFGYVKGGEPGLELLTKEGKTATLLTLNSDGLPLYYLNYKDESPAIGIAVSAQGPGLAMMHGEGAKQENIVLAINPTGPSLSMKNSDGKQREIRP